MFRANRKGVELSINAIIIMVLALLILAIGAFLIIKGTNSLNDATTCKPPEGMCQSDKLACPSDYPAPSPFSCSNKGDKCCTKLEGIS